ncbi:IS1/IS1595 family N-terminal zinc-binding domain-containing protein [Sutcliffiella horikoshii]|uniref:IS1/IS1595 family N-terminal zinc-binding domain-containing protein n=1 Tax=Sutcliffiella horikoshii TaxID=79883 RepID=UPI003CF16E75
MSAVVSHGKYRGLQRYKCKVCKQTFKDIINTTIICGTVILSRGYERINYVY